MSLPSGAANNPAIDELVQSSLKSKNENLRLEWIPCSQITNVEPTQMDNVYYAIHYYTKIVLVFLGNSKECTPIYVSEFSRIYSLPTHQYKNNVGHFRRYSIWLERRNRLIKGFTKNNDNY